ncbi:hypothetical protein OQJ26_19240 [Legionella sp. PATHC038]|uniref:hypothetical protein n=1 Tax=Legionella sheltonii TaxID=2992041 RepID=UPI0022448517|nr:hypothetical protein [Legionella sp. PATHC038]MCW8400360.1 hypothetical protein [Legionella sp. PATHC038]MCW8400918.1 hypothetical protein [Legionella sp. PATHC038]
MKPFFKPAKPAKPAKRLISFKEYMEDTLVTAKRITEISPGLQRYSGAQFEIALISFADLETLKKEMDVDLEVEFPELLELDWQAGFDWLDLAVHYGDEDAIKYFKDNMQKEVFAMNYHLYKTECRPDTVLQRHEHVSKPEQMKF